jgi:FtsH-binding integral membrane protein
MELEQVKAAWQREKAAYFHKVDPKAIMADTKQKAMKMDRDFKRQQRTQILCGLLCLGLMAAWYRREGPLLANAGLIVMLLCCALMLAGSIILKYRLRESHPELPREEYLAEQRKKIAARIALLRRNVRWFFIPSLLGLLTWQLGLSHSVQMVVALVIIATLVSTGAFWFYRWKLRKDLLPILDDIDRELESFRK